MKRVRSQYCKLRDSSIHNKGVFATKDIPKGTRIIEYVGEKITKSEAERRADKQFQRAERDPSNGAVYLFTLNKRYDIDGNVHYNTARFINHSCDPNCESDVIRGKIWIISTRDIKSGEELTYDYGYDLDDWQDHPCRCGKPNCIGYIVAQEHWPKLKRILKNR